MSLSSNPFSAASFFSIKSSGRKLAGGGAFEFGGVTQTTLIPMHKQRKPEGLKEILTCRTGRRVFLGQVAAASSTLLLQPHSAFAAEAPARKRSISAFIKFIQSLNYEQMAQSVAEIGFDGVESTVRKGGHVLPERVEEDLPRQLEAVKKAGLEMTLITTDVLSLNQPLTRGVLETAAGLGIKRYRMGFFYYSKSKPLDAQLRNIHASLIDLAAFNREHGLSAVYQNHSGADYVGAPIWDICQALEGISPDEIGLAFDIRHATIEGGLAWPLNYRRAKPHVRAYFMKDFDWDGLRDIHVPLGTGRVDPAYFAMLREQTDAFPVSLHIEYLEEAGVEENLQALRRDLATLRGLL